jgi:hypothetical protein
LATWVERPDPASQAESRIMPFSRGIISARTSVRIPKTLYRNLGRSSSEARTIFDVIAMRISHVFPGWKGTRCDFRFADQLDTRVFVLTPKRKFILVEIRIDVTGYRNRNNLFPAAPATSSQYPGNWVRANVDNVTVATAIADDVERQLQ